MPKQSDFSKGLIYKICCKDPKIKDIYVGSTCNFIKRKSSHKASCNKPENKAYNSPVYKFIRDHMGWDNWKMILVKDFKCNSRLELEKEEQAVMEELEEYCTLNRIRAWRSEEYKKEYYKDYDKKYYTNNKDRIREQISQYRQDNKEKIKKSTSLYYQKNKDSIQEQHKKYASQLYTCVCGSTIRLDSKSKHKKTKKHQNYLKSLNN